MSDTCEDNIIIDINDTDIQTVTLDVAQGALSIWGTIIGELSAQTDLYQALSGTGLQTLYYEESSQNLYISQGNFVSLSSLSDISLTTVLRYLSTNAITLSTTYIDGTLFVNSSATINGSLSVAGNAYIDGTLYTSGTAYVLDTFFDTIGDGVTSAFNINHNLNTQDLYVVVRDLETNLLSYPAIQITDLDNITISFNFVPEPDSYGLSIFTGKPSNRVSAYTFADLPERPRANTFYVTISGNDTNSGTDPNFSLRTIKKACELAHNNRVLSKNNPDIKYTIFVGTGDYYEENPIYVPPNASLIGDNLRRASIYPINRQYDILWCDNSVYVWGFTFRGHLEPAAATAFPNYQNPALTAVALKNLHTPFVSGTTYRWRKPYITTSPYIQGSSSITQGLPPLLQAPINVTQTYNPNTFLTASLVIPNVEKILDTVIGIIQNGYNSFTPITFTPTPDTSTAVALISAHTQYIQDKSLDYITKNFPWLDYNRTLCRRDIGFMLSAVCEDLQNGNNTQGIINGQAYYMGAVNSVLPVNQKIPTINTFANLKTLVSYVLKGEYLDRSDIDTAFDIVTNIMTFGPDAYTFLNYDKEKCKRDVGFILSAVRVDIQTGNNQQAITYGQAYYNGMNLVIPTAQVTPTIRAIQHAQTLVKNYATASLAIDSLIAIDISFNTLVGILSGGLNNYTFQVFPVPSTAAAAAAAIINNTEQIKTGVISYLDSLYPNSVKGIYPGALSAAQMLQLNKSFIQKETIAFLDRVYPNLVYNKEKCERDVGYILSAVQVDIQTGDYEESIYNGQSYYNGNNLYIPQNQVLPTVTALNYAKRLAKFVTTNQPVKGLNAGGGMRVDGRDAEGFLRSFVLDSYTQFNEGGYGIYVTNNGYAQLVSIFTICCIEGVKADSGGSCSINTSNCSFGLSGIVAIGKSPTPVLTGVLVNDPFRTDEVIVTNVSGVDVFPNSDYYPSVLFSPLGLDTRKIAYTPYNGLIFTIGNDPTIYPIQNSPQVVPNSPNTYSLIVPENIRANYTPGDVVRFYIRSVVTTSSHTFEYIGSGTVLRNAVPALGGPTTPETEAVAGDGGAVFFTSTNQAGNFRVGPDFTIVQETGTIEGDTFKRSILTLVTPLNLALE
jgi:hypothetical protein